jgi:hypothetical protein
MDRNYVISNSKLIARTAAAMKDSNVPVGDEIWQSLIAMLPRAKTLAAHPSLLDDITLKPETAKTWVQVKHVAWSILDSMLGPGWAPAMDESEVRAYIRNAPDEGWQYPSGGQVFSRFNDDEYICLTREAINFTCVGNLISCAHTSETRARYEYLLQRTRRSRINASAS